MVHLWASVSVAGSAWRDPAWSGPACTAFLCTVPLHVWGVWVLATCSFALPGALKETWVREVWCLLGNVCFPVLLKSKVHICSRILSFGVFPPTSRSAPLAKHPLLGTCENQLLWGKGISKYLQKYMAKLSRSHWCKIQSRPLSGKSVRHFCGCWREEESGKTFSPHNVLWKMKQALSPDIFR